MSPKPGTAGFAVGQKAGTGAAAAMVVLDAAEKRADAAVAGAVCQSADPAALFVGRRESLEDVAVQAGAVMRCGRGDPVAGGSLGFAAAATGMTMRTAAAVAAAAAAAADTECLGVYRPAVRAPALAEELVAAAVVVGTDSSGAAVVRDLGCAAERLQVAGSMPTAGQRAGRRLNLEAAAQLTDNLDTVVDSPAAVVVADPGDGWGCSALPRPDFGSYLRCLPCRVGAECTAPGADWQRIAGGVADTAGPLVVPLVCLGPAGGRGRGRGCLRLARLRWAAAAGTRGAGGTAAATRSAGAARLAGGILAVDSPCPELIGVFRERSCWPASWGRRPCGSLSVPRRGG